jgi:hypothetical protein
VSRQLLDGPVVDPASAVTCNWADFELVWCRYCAKSATNRPTYSKAILLLIMQSSSLYLNVGQFSPIEIPIPYYFKIHIKGEAFKTNVIKMCSAHRPSWCWLRIRGFRSPPLCLSLGLSLNTERDECWIIFQYTSYTILDRLCGLEVRVPGYDYQHYQIFWVAVGVERCPFSIVSINEELRERKNSDSGIENWNLLKWGFRSADQVTPHYRQIWH